MKLRLYNVYLIHGFSIIELMMVVVIIALLAAVTVPGLIKYIRLTQTTEARTNLRKIYDGEVAYYYEESLQTRPLGSGQELEHVPTRSFVSVAASPPTIPAGTKQYGVWEQGQWPLIHFGVDTPVAYQYVVIANGTGNDASFTARARGDLDGDRITSLFERVGTVDSSGQVVGGEGLYHNRDTE